MATRVQASRVQASREDLVVSPALLPVSVTGMQSMASKMWVPFIGMGFMIVEVAMIIGIFASVSAAECCAASRTRVSR